MTIANTKNRWTDDISESVSWIEVFSTTSNELIDGLILADFRVFAFEKIDDVLHLYFIQHVEDNQTIYPKINRQDVASIFSFWNLEEDFSKAAPARFKYLRSSQAVKGQLTVVSFADNGLFDLMLEKKKCIEDKISLNWFFNKSKIEGIDKDCDYSDPIVHKNTFELYGKETCSYDYFFLGGSVSITSLNDGDAVTFQLKELNANGAHQTILVDTPALQYVLSKLGIKADLKIFHITTEGTWYSSPANKDFNRTLIKKSEDRFTGYTKLSSREKMNMQYKKVKEQNNPFAALAVIKEKAREQAQGFKERDAMRRNKSTN